MASGDHGASGVAVVSTWSQWLLLAQSHNISTRIRLTATGICSIQLTMVADEKLSESCANEIANESCVRRRGFLTILDNKYFRSEFHVFQAIFAHYSRMRQHLNAFLLKQSHRTIERSIDIPTVAVHLNDVAAHVQIFTQIGSDRGHSFGENVDIFYSRVFRIRETFRICYLNSIIITVV